MRKINLTTILLLILSVAYSQDTIFSYYYPQGIVTNNLVEKRNVYELTPIENPDLKIKIRKESTRKIIYGNGSNFTNPSPVDYLDEVVLSSDTLTGKIYYTGVIEVNGIKKKALFDLAKSIPQQGIIKYNLLTSDEVDFSFQKYNCSFLLKFAGEPYVLTCNLLIKFKDGKVKYEYSDFTASFTYLKTSRGHDWSYGLNTVNKERTMILDKMYAGLGRSDTRTFWRPIPLRINESINTLKRICSNSSNDENNW